MRSQRERSIAVRPMQSEQLCISCIEGSTIEVDVLLLGLNAAEGNELRQLASSSHEGVSAVAEIVVEQTAQGRHERVIGA